jgi:RNA polymerase sigma factor (sigma-70 family)
MELVALRMYQRGRGGIWMSPVTGNPAGGRRAGRHLRYAPAGEKGGGDMDTTALLGAAAQGDQSAWNSIVDRYQSLLWSVVRSYRLSDSDAQDVIQTTWLRLVEHLGSLRDAEALAGWLGTTVRRECLQLFRRSGRISTTNGDEWEQVVDPAPPIDHALLVDERDAALWRALTALSDRCQRLLRILMASPPPAYGAVAAALDMPVGSIGPSRQRCLERLRRVVAGEGEVLGRGWTENRT